MSNSPYKNSKTQGNAGIGSAIEFATSSGYGVAIPLTDNQEYDLIIDIGSKLCKVQVKTTFHKTRYGVYSAMLATKGGNQSYHTTKHFDPNKVDFLFILCGDGSRYFIPSAEVDNKTTINLGEKYLKFKT